MLIFVITLDFEVKKIQGVNCNNYHYFYGICYYYNWLKNSKKIYNEQEQYVCRLWNVGISFLYSILFEKKNYHKNNYKFVISSGCTILKKEIFKKDRRCESVGRGINKLYLKVDR